MPDEIETTEGLDENRLQAIEARIANGKATQADAAYLARQVRRLALLVGG